MCAAGYAHVRCEFDESTSATYDRCCEFDLLWIQTQNSQFENKVALFVKWKNRKHFSSAMACDLARRRVILLTMAPEVF